jgi:hypothetical protein
VGDPSAIAVMLRGSTGGLVGESLRSARRGSVLSTEARTASCLAHSRGLLKVPRQRAGRWKGTGGAAGRDSRIPSARDRQRRFPQSALTRGALRAAAPKSCSHGCRGRLAERDRPTACQRSSADSTALRSACGMGAIGSIAAHPSTRRGAESTAPSRRPGRTRVVRRVPGLRLPAFRSKAQRRIGRTGCRRRCWASSRRLRLFPLSALSQVMLLPWQKRLRVGRNLEPRHDLSAGCCRR